MATLFLRRVGNALYPVDQDGAEHPMSRTWKDGEIVRCDVRKPRNIGLHRKAFILLQVVYPHTNYPSMEALRHAMTVGAGYVDTVINPITNEVHLVPKSWSFDKLDDLAFSALYSAMIGVAINIVADSTAEDWEFAVDEIARL